MGTVATFDQIQQADPTSTSRHEPFSIVYFNPSAFSSKHSDFYDDRDDDDASSKNTTDLSNAQDTWTPGLYHTRKAAGN